MRSNSETKDKVTPLTRTARTIADECLRARRPPVTEFLCAHLSYVLISAPVAGDLPCWAVASYHEYECWVQGKGRLSYGHHHNFQAGHTSHRRCHARYQIEIFGPKTVANMTPVLGLLPPSRGRRDGLPMSRQKGHTWHMGCSGVKGTVSTSCAWVLSMITAWQCPSSRRHAGGRKVGARGKRKRRRKGADRRAKRGTTEVGLRIC